MKSIQNRYLIGFTMKASRYGPKREELFDNQSKLGKHNIEGILCLNGTTLPVETDSKSK